MAVQAEEPESVSELAIASFQAANGRDQGHPVCIVIAAYNEVGSVAEVLRSLPARVAGLDADCVIVDDGSTDGTAEAAAGAGALVCRLGRNLGQGWALRTGYRLAANRGARVIVTMDADGQFDPSELDGVVGPVTSGAADMVVGSRRLGRAETSDRLRSAGVVFFGRLISALTGTTLTDPSNGFRAFLPDVPAQVPLRQAQYQAAELLIGALGAGFRVVEVPVTVRARAAGVSKKGTNLLYGWHFMRVVLTTWWSAGRGRSRRGRLPSPGRGPRR